MTLSDLAAIGSFVSGFAVVISLLALTLQMRQNTIALQRAEANASQNQASAFRLSIVNNRDVASLWTVGTTDNGTLDAIDDQRFGLLLSEMFWVCAHVFDRTTRGLFAAAEWNGARQWVATLLAQKCAALWWSSSKYAYPNEFVNEIERIIVEQAEAKLKV